MNPLRVLAEALIAGGYLAYLAALFLRVVLRPLAGLVLALVMIFVGGVLYGGLWDGLLIAILPAGLLLWLMAPDI